MSRRILRLLRRANSSKLKEVASKSQLTASSLHPLPNNIFIISSVDQTIHLAIRSALEQRPALNTPAEKKPRDFRKQLRPRPVAALPK